MSSLNQKYRPSKLSEVQGQDYVKEVIKKIAENPDNVTRSIILCGGYGVGKCVSGDTYIKSDKGLVRIKDLFKGLELKPDTFYPVNNLNVLVNNNKESISHLYYSGIKDSIKITTSNGIKLEGSQEHPILVWDNDNLTTKWTKLKDLNLGQHLIIDQTSPTFDVSKEYIFDYRNSPKEIPQEIVDFLPKVLNEELAYFLGIMILGDSIGTKTDRILYKSKNIQQVSFVKYIYNKYFHTKVRTIKVGFSDTFMKPEKSIYLRTWFEYLGLYGKDLINQTIPQQILDSNHNIQGEFVKAFLEFELESNSNGLDFKLNNIEYLEFIQHYLFSLSVESKLLSNKSGQSLKINLDQLRKTRLYIKSELYNRLSFIQKNNYSYNSHPNLMDVYKNVIIKHSDNIPSKIKNELKRIIKYYGINHSYERVKKIFEDLNIFDYSIFKYSFQEIVSIEHSQTELFDLTNPNSHSFVANSIIVHNTTISRLFSKVMNCTNKIDGDICNECDNCKNINSGDSTMYLEFDASQVGNVDSMKQIRDTVSYTVGNDYKIVVIDEPHLISKQAFSTMLKVLEDITGKIFYIFPTTDPEKLLETIKSRSLILELELLTKQQVVDNLNRIYKIETQSDKILSPEILDFIFRRSKGHMRDAVQQLELYLKIGHDLFIKKINLLDKQIFNLIKQIYLNKDSDLDLEITTQIDSILKNPINFIKQDFDFVIKALSKLVYNTSYVKEIPFDKKTINNVVVYYRQNNRYLHNDCDWYSFLYSLTTVIREPEILGLL